MRTLLLLSACLGFLVSCDPTTTTTVVTPSPTTLYSFVFMGCNRVDRHDTNKTAATNASTANLAVLKKIYQDITTLPRQPELFFFLGDLVLGETDTTKLNQQLKAWVELYQDTSFSAISQGSIELVAVPGNHEMLTYHHKKERPLKGATEVWMRHMSPFIPADAQHVTGKDNSIQKATFSFKRGSIGFIVMNTDTYNDLDTHGLEGKIPVQWIREQAQQFHVDSTINHIFVLGHKPYYVMGTPRTDHTGLADGPALWPILDSARVVALLSSHVHDYYREQPQDTGTYQIIAGNGGSPPITGAQFFGYTIINIMSDGTVELDSRGMNIGSPYYQLAADSTISSRDTTTLTWGANANPYKKQ